MGVIKALFSKGLSSLLGNWREIAAIIAIIWVINTVMGAGEKIGTLSTETKQLREGFVDMQSRLDDLGVLHKQMIAIGKEQLELSKKLGVAYEEQRTKNEADTNAKLSSISDGTLRLSIRKPVAAKSPVPFPAAH